MSIVTIAFTDAAALAHLLKYHSILGIYPGSVAAVGDALAIDGKHLRVLAKRNLRTYPGGTSGSIWCWNAPAGSQTPPRRGRPSSPPARRRCEVV